MALELGIPLTTFAEVEEIDLTIDGADEINPDLNLIKGGGGALLREKLVAAASRRLVIVADSSKRVATLGTFPLPVEIIPFAWEVTKRRIAALNCAPTLRTSNGSSYVTDNGNYILDCACGAITDPVSLERQLKLLPGVVETGLFVGMADLAIIAGVDGISIIERGQLGGGA
jgi:ribose 5-phosphate isomerase A